MISPIASHQDATFTPRLRARAAQLVTFENFFGSFALSNTLKLMLSSIGDFSAGFKFHNLESRQSWQRIGEAGHIPFTLTEEGMAFIRGSSRFDDWSDKAHLVVSQKDGGFSTSKQNEQQIVGMKALPCGIMVVSRDQRRSLYIDLTEFILGNQENTMLGRNLVAALYALEQKILPRPAYKTWEYVASSSSELTGYDRRMNLLFVGEEWYKPFSDGSTPPVHLQRGFIHSDKDSIDFQTFLVENARLFLGKRVAEVGSGTGVNLVHALQLGASAVTATEPSVFYALMALWNLQYAEDTEQIAKGSVVRSNLILGPGVPDYPAEVYLGNLPKILEIGDLQSRRFTRDSMADPLLALSLAFTEPDFMGLYKPLEERVIRDGAKLLLRIMPALKVNDSVNFALPEDQLRAIRSNEEDFWHLDCFRARSFLESRALANKLCWKQGNELEPLFMVWRERG
jgi:hypothetical protein